MKKQFIAAAAALLVAGMATAQTVSVIGLDGSTIATYGLDQIDQIVFTPAETPDEPIVNPNIPEGAIVLTLEEGFKYEGNAWECDYDAVLETLEVPSLSDTYVELYALQGEDWSDNYTANPPGFWFDYSSTICNWGEGASVFMEYEDGVFYYGQMEGNTHVAGDVQVVTLCLMANDIKVPFTFAFQWVKPEDIVGTVEYTESIEGSYPQNDGYEALSIPFDTVAAAAAIGVENLNEAKFVLQEPDGNYVNVYSANAGYWVNAEGANNGWGEGAAMFIEYVGEDAINVGQMPGVEMGTYKATVGFFANNKFALIDVTYTVTEPVEVPAE